MCARKFFVGGNFKMNGSLAQIKGIVDGLNSADLNQNAEVVISPPALYLAYTKDLLKDGKNKNIEVAAQNVFNKGNGAFTGEISVSQLSDLGINWVILGHSERRQILGESDEFIASKTKAAIDGGLQVIWCCGEPLEIREAGTTTDYVTKQIAALAKVLSPEDWTKVVIAYEPIWAIGTGKVATTQQAQDTHKDLREWLAKNVSEKVANETRILYGGSVTDENSKELATQPDVDGFLVGGASLKPAFIKIVNSA
ncbi:Triosephosphate isomerase [Ascobolus immersus RN42]|uniref:Triosephosphate isomerase n=1 Tax=Ascobolus immersus RN42 TaxID=1160509 RepID=A0A3N4HYX7_ASCIM|nr:Triosephosphate isomerase [Ascobolus immersus RN42]